MARPALYLLIFIDVRLESPTRINQQPEVDGAAQHPSATLRHQRERGRWARGTPTLAGGVTPDPVWDIGVLGDPSQSIALAADTTSCMGKRPRCRTASDPRLASLPASPFSSPPPHTPFFFFYGEIIIYSLISSCFYGNSMAALGGGVKTSRGNGNICEGAERVGARLRRVARGGKCPSPECRSRTCVHNHIHMLTSKSSGSSSEITNARVAVKQICIYKPPRRARALRTGGGGRGHPLPSLALMRKERGAGGALLPLIAGDRDSLVAMSPR